MTDYQSLTYLDNAATTPMPEEVLAVIDDYYRFNKVNVHRGIYQLAGRVTSAYEAVREQIAQWLHAPQPESVVFTSGTTDALNQVAFGYAQPRLQPGDEIIVSVLEHHSNLVPWQRVAAQTGAHLRIVGMDSQGNLDYAQLAELINTHTKVVALTMVSNVLGTVVDVAKIAQLVHQYDGILVVDAAQAVAHLPIDVTAMDADFLAFSGHKMFGPTGIGVLYGKLARLEEMEPVRFGGEMVDLVTPTSATFQPLPIRLEAGTPNVAGVLGLGAAVKYLEKQNFAAIQKHEARLMQFLLTELQEVPEVKIYGPLDYQQRVGAVSFNVGKHHAHDVATILDASGVAVRAGHLCAEPLMQALNVSSVVRASFTFENQVADLQRLVDAVEQVGRILSWTIYKSYTKKLF